MAIKIEMLRCFRAVADTGSLAEAATSLGRTPSAVSMMLRQFEEHIGAPLFETGRKSHLTPLGQLIRQEATRELAHFERTVAAIEGLAKAEQGHVRLVATPSVVQVVLPPILRSFMARHPEVQIDLRDADSIAVEEDLRNERVDIGLASIGPVAGYERQKLLSDPFGVICPAAHPLAGEKRLTWDALRDQTFIAHGLCPLIEDEAFQPILENATLMMHSTGSILNLVRAGVGLTILPRLAMLPQSGDLAFVPLNTTPASRDVFLFTPEANRQTPATQAMVAAILAAEIQNF
ncbi:MAG: LysR family transcriptional regulator [Pseudomonadota bacterium]